MAKIFSIVDNVTDSFAANEDGELYQFADEAAAGTFARELNARFPNKQFGVIQTGGDGTVSRNSLIDFLLKTTPDSGYGRMRH